MQEFESVEQHCYQKHVALAINVFRNRPLMLLCETHFNNLFLNPNESLKPEVSSKAIIDMKQDKKNVIYKN